MAHKYVFFNKSSDGRSRAEYHMDIESEFIDEPKNETEVNFECGQKLCVMYPALENILIYLNAVELRSAACVCKAWNEVARKILRKRFRFSWASLILKSTYKSSQLNSPDWHWSPVSLPIIFISSKFLSSLNRKINVENKDGVVKNWITRSWITNCLMQTRYLPHLEIQSVHTELLNVREMTNVTILAQFCALPKIPNVQIEIQDMAAVKKKLVEFRAEPPKALLMFVKISSHVSLYLHTIAPKKDPTSMAFAGGLVPGIKYCKKSPVAYDKGGTGIAFYEDPDVESKFDAYSFILGEERINYEEILTEQKSKMKFREHSLIFKMTCTAFNMKAEENKALLRVFPNIPIYSTNVDGEFGWESNISTEVLNEPPTKKLKKTEKPNLPEFTHEYTSCYLLLTWGEFLHK